MRITGYESDNGKLTAVIVTDETRGFYDKRFVPERPHGEWIPCNIRNIKDVYKCSICSWFKNHTPCFCENCGADMRKEGEWE